MAEHNTSSIFNVAIGAYEACLAVLAYCVAADALYEDRSWRGLANLQHRSLGPLRALLGASLGKNAAHGCVSHPREVERMEFLDEAVRHFTDSKHHKASQVSPKWVEYVEEIACATAGALSGNYFGYCATSEQGPL